MSSNVADVSAYALTLLPEVEEVHDAAHNGVVAREKFESFGGACFIYPCHANISLLGFDVSSPDILSDAIHWIVALLGHRGLEVHPPIFITRVGAIPSEMSWVAKHARRV